MAITQISRITHRKGLRENLPQLANGELGWAVDERRLFIGNDPVFAPEFYTHFSGSTPLNVTEILTEHSDLLGISSSYQYRGDAAGYAHQTHARPLIAKLDERVSVKDYGATGNGIDDDTIAIQNALMDLYTRQPNPQVRRVLFFPAGRYRITGLLIIPAFAVLVGEGKNQSIIEYHGPVDEPYCVRTADSKGQVSNDIGTNGALLPQHIVVANMRLSTTRANSVMLAEAVDGLVMFNVSLAGNGRPLVGSQAAGTGLHVTGIPGSLAATGWSKNVYLNNVTIEDIDLAAKIDGNSENITASAGLISNVRYGLDVSSSTNVKISVSKFNDITYSALKVRNDAYGVTSSFNTYTDVATSNSDGVIEFLSDDNISIGDMFWPSASASKNVRIGRTTSIAFNSAQSIQQGSYQRETGRTVDLTPLAVDQPLFSVSYLDYRVFRLDYTVQRGDYAYRHGSLTVSARSDLQVPHWSEDYTENVNSGVVFSVSRQGLVITIRYTLTENTVEGGTVRYSITKLL